ncbi:MAG: bifunctional phosphopantothenoylcysteine decarboxylase/phosphopantothenate--cysteine ligase CoaBC [Bacteroidia bacterium]|nr:bifunctional phosphopantothenoylcysteine decarboxylase/phosphopantothenate--cysteine ligase CoaBC [Bacteroidia bacterium]MDW8133613.1 bifunctional phosphopantothenoylcysteine decarboxylase/phosphopantothenate--cysteine ligase CoaBC [Bacteroidia bacterium]
MAHILLGVTGSIAAYKAPFLVRALQKRGHEVTVVLTRGAKAFVSPLVLEVLTRRPVLEDMWSVKSTGERADKWIQHIALATQVDAILIAPITAHTIAKLARGLCDDLLSAVFLATRKPVLIAPAMEENMYFHPAVQANIRLLQKRSGVFIIPPGKGFLASGGIGKGRLAAPTRILWAVERALSPPLLKGKRILITAGATRESWDSVRFLSNGSTGRMALALAEAAYALGAEEIHILAAHLEVRFPKGILRITPALAAEDMMKSFQQIYERYDWILFTAAVSDYKFAEKFEGKRKKAKESVHIELVPTADILAWAGAHKKPSQVLIGFALENEGEIHYAQEKVFKKKADWIAFNPISANTGMSVSTNSITLLSRWGHQYNIPLASKAVIAKKMLIFIADAMAGRVPNTSS